jgi:vacuolar protein sorting-associated protein 13A/C
LEDIVIKSKPINDLKLPFKLIYGRIGKLDIKIPWKSNFSAPTVINIETVQVVVSLIHQENWDFMDFISYDAKISYLNKFAQERIQELQEAFIKKEENSNFSERALLKILDNLHVNFKNIHIRIEENIQAPFYSFGVTLKEMLVVNTNENWVEQFIDRNKTKNINVYKLLKISNFGIYLNSNENNFLTQHEANKDEIRRKMNEMLPLGSQKAQSIKYLIQPSTIFF